MKTIRDALQNFDGKRTASLSDVAKSLSQDAASVRALIRAAQSDNPIYQIGATWILKRFFETGYTFTAAQSKSLFAVLLQTNEPDAKLHILQVTSGLTIPPDNEDAIREALLDEIANDHKFVRAWAYHALAELADRRPNMQSKVANLLAAAKEHGPASVRARIRNIIKEKEWARDE